MADEIKTPDFLGLAEDLIKDARRHAKVYCLQWFDDSFKNQGFTDAAFKAWPKRKNDKEPGRAILVKTTFLRKSLGILDEDENSITFGTHVPYAAVHNNGLRVRAVQNVRAHHRRSKYGNTYQVKAHTRQMNTKFPERKFIGHSNKMMTGLDNWIKDELVKRFKQL